MVPRKLAPCDWLGITLEPMYKRSNRPTIATKLVSLNRLITWLTIGGITALNACGMIIKVILCSVLNPTASAASNWPLFIDCSPPLTFSAKYAELNIAVTTIALNTSSNSTPLGKKRVSITLPKKSHVMNGTDLTNSITAVHIILITGNLEVRPKANRTPKGKDIAIPKNANNHVSVNPPYIEDPGTTISDSEEAPLISNMRINTATLQTIERFFADSLELAIVGATEIKSHVMKNNIFNCLSTGRKKITTERTNIP